MARAKRLDRIFAAYFELLEEGHGFRPAWIAERADVTSANLRKDIVCEKDLLMLFRDQLDEAALNAVAGEEAGHAAMLEGLCARLEASFPYRSGLKVLRRRTLSNPLMAMCKAGSLAQSLGWMADAAKFEAHDCRATRDVQLVALYDRALQKLVHDDENLTKTMALLDQGLMAITRRQESLSAMRPKRRSRKEAEPSSA